MDSSLSGKDEIWFLRVCHQVPHELYIFVFVCTSCNFSYLSSSCKILPVLEVYKVIFSI